MARPLAPDVRWVSTSIVGRPRESHRRRPITRSMLLAMLQFRVPYTANHFKMSWSRLNQRPRDPPYKLLIRAVEILYWRLAIDACQQECRCKSGDSCLQNFHGLPFDAFQIGFAHPR